MNNKVSDRIVNDEQMSQISGGVAEEGTYKDRICPICGGEVKYSRNTRYEGGDVTLYKCTKCNREFSHNQIMGMEGLTCNYTGLGNDNFGMV